MARYDLKYAPNSDGIVEMFSFEERSLSGALDMARKLARGDWAELYREGRPVCQMELVAESGVWLVGAPHSETSSDAPSMARHLPT